MYEFILRKHYSKAYDVYKDGVRVRDENDFCVIIEEENRHVVFFNAYTAHNLVNVKEIVGELIAILMMIDSRPWTVIKGYEYLINIALREELEKII